MALLYVNIEFSVKTFVHMIIVLIVKGIIIITKHFINQELQWIAELNPIIFIDSFNEVSISIETFWNLKSCVKYLKNYK